MSNDTITKSITVKADVNHVYQVWENFDNFPMFMKYIKSVHKMGDDLSHWQVEGPLGKNVEWDAEMTAREPYKRIGWSTKDRQGDITTSGQVLFNPLPDHNQTEVTVMFHFNPKGGVLGEAVAKLFADPARRLEEDLQHFKDYVEGRYDRLAAN